MAATGGVAACWAVDTGTAALIGAAVNARSITAAKALVAWWVGIISAARRVICSRRSRTDGSSTDAYRHSTAYGCTAINATTMNGTVMNAAVMNATASATTATASSSEGVG
jgi:hypothetical protein